MPVALVVLMTCLLAFWPQTARSEDTGCTTFPAGSLGEIECRYVQAKLQEQRDPANAAQLVALPLESAIKFVCPDEKAAEIGGLEGLVGDEVRGTYRNVGQRPFSEIIVAFLLYDAKDQLMKTVESAVLPRTIGPGEAGKFAAVLPSPWELGWRCFRYDISGVPE